ncbi:hypothetical protein NW754_007443 [Fusarium falciforme]|uniref:Uncharacterized protein n=1 Tax=Fusarium falciforme TaxID=195108 RepID=A0A9W8QY52_9HYPO|nr:hypothetical protein NW754_007443 [Fusarium falciforme]KAJ4179808.1 hypothetical protein NW755_012204 [Fusarium falciforme]
MKVAYVLPALLSVAHAGIHINYYSDTKCKNWIGQKDIGQGWGEQTFASPNGAHGALPVETAPWYRVEFYDNNNPQVKYSANDGQCFGTKGKPITHIKPW